MSEIEEAVTDEASPWSVNQYGATLVRFECVGSQYSVPQFAELCQYGSGEYGLEAGWI